MKLTRYFAIFIVSLIFSGTALAIDIVGNEILVDTTTQNDHQSSKITVLSGGSFVVTWRDIVDSDIKAQLFAADGSQIGDQIKVDTGTGSIANPQIIARPDGGFIITWVVDEIKAQIFSTDGSKVGSEILVNTTTQSFQINPQIAALPDGGFVIAWEDTSISGDLLDRDIRTQLFAADGSKVGGEVLVNTATQNRLFNTQIVALSDGGFAINWVKQVGDNSIDRDIGAQAFAADGSKVGGEILVNTATQNPQDTPQITALPNGDFVITWHDFSQGVGGATGDNDFAIKAQVFAADGSKVGNEILVNTATLNSQNDPEITALSDGGFVVVWVDFSQSVGGAGGDFSGTAIKAQVFAADGSKVGGEILVNTATQNDQNKPQITALSNGGFIVAWEDAGTSGNFNEQDVRAQAFTANGNKIGDEVLVNTATQNSQRNPEMAVLPDNSFVIAWEDNSQVGENVADGFTGVIRDFVIKAQVFKISENELINASVDSIFNWAESVYSNLFPIHTASQNIEGYYARLYENGNAVGERDGSIYYYDGSSIILVGEIDDFLPDALAAGF